MDAEQLRDEFRAGRIDGERLIDVISAMQRRIAELERKAGAEPTRKVAEPFSLRAEEQRQAARGNKPPKKNRPLRRGRIATAEKIRQARRTEQVFPAGCWRFIARRAECNATDV